MARRRAVRPGQRDRRLTHTPHAKLAWIAKTHPRLHRAGALKEGLRCVFTLAKTSPAAAVEALDRWIAWARRSRLDVFVGLQRRIVRHRDQIRAAIEHRLSNGRRSAQRVQTAVSISLRA